MQIKTIPLGPLGTNCYLVYQQDDAVIFDPGGDSEKLISLITELGVIPLSICLTHAHFDHIGAVDEIRDYYNIPVYVQQSEANWLENAELNGSLIFQMGKISCKPAEYFLEEGVTKIGRFSFEVRHVPGHSPGGVVFIFHENKFVIGGDSLFHSGIGRSDLPGGNMEQLLQSIKEKLLTLDDDYVVYPGHGPETTIGNESKNNPFLS
ncbi:MBL fold metallo-hydrolase [Aquibacillus kalidii]|uniref:MBL fold metallo-hydrolase n=1 Tax=Aquibacillus kalidii TaxID=2762597 RepID=UPI0016490147|nr:MBL fold metallo-hydrolase [Aquibacillus kalidii]